MRIFFEATGTSGTYLTYSPNSGHCPELRDIAHLKTTILYCIIWGIAMNHSTRYRIVPYPEMLKNKGWNAKQLNFPTKGSSPSSNQLPQVQTK
jgi:hypothetical protein